jgi:hypothetical protein
MHLLRAILWTVFELIVPDTRLSVINQATRDALQAWGKDASLKSQDFLFPSRLHESPN